MMRCLAAIILAGLAGAAAAAPCAPRERLLAALASRYGEQVVARGVGVGGRLVELTASVRGSFSVLATRPDGLSCVVEGGDGFKLIEWPLPLGAPT